MPNLVPDGLAEKLQTAFREAGSPDSAEPWTHLDAGQRATWEAVAATARMESLRSMANLITGLVAMGGNDPIATAVRPGLLFIVDMIERTLEIPLAEAKRIAGIQTS